MGLIKFYEASFSPETDTYKIRVKDDEDVVTDIPVKSIEEYTAILTMLGRKAAILSLKNRAIELVPRAVGA